MRTLAVVLLVVTAPAAAAAHAIDMGALEVAVEGDRIRESLFLSSVSLSTLAPLDADGDGQVDDGDLRAGLAGLHARTLGLSPPTAGDRPCSLAPVSAKLEGIGVRLVAEGTCPEGPLRQKLAFLSKLSELHRIVVQADADGAKVELVADHARPVFFLERNAQKQGGGVLSFVALGVEHIFAGWDHLVFLLGLLLAGGGLKRLLLIVSAFTVAHSITLALAALQLVVLPSRLVESGIALSIMYVAVENFFGAQGERRWALAFLFGLVHGFGFASALTEMHLSPSGVASALVGFNVGVELGQAALVVPVAPLIALARRRQEFLRFGVPALSLVTLAAGAYWFVGRAFAG